MKKVLALFAVAFASLYSFGQGACFSNGTATTTNSTLQNSSLREISYATIRVCNEPSSGTPCTPLTTIYNNPDLLIGHRLSNPFQTDVNGNYYFCVQPPAVVHIQISGPQVQTQDIPYVTLGVSGGGCNCPKPYDVIFALPGTIGSGSGQTPAGTVFPIETFAREVDFPADFVGSTGSNALTENATSPNTWLIYKNTSTVVGTIVIATDGTFTFTSTSHLPVTFLTGDRMTTSVGVADATLGDVAFTLAGSRPN